MRHPLQRKSVRVSERKGWISLFDSDKLRSHVHLQPLIKLVTQREIQVRLTDPLGDQTYELLLLHHHSYLRR